MAIEATIVSEEAEAALRAAMLASNKTAQHLAERRPDADVVRDYQMMAIRAELELIESKGVEPRPGFEPEKRRF